MRPPDYPQIDVPLSVEVDAYLQGLLVPADPVLSAVLANCDAAGLPPHEVSALQAQFLSLMVRITRATRVLEIGTLGGYSAICMARELPVGGRLCTIEVDALCADTAAANFGIAGLLGRVELHRGAALSVLPNLRGPFDLIFIDADKPNNPAYLQWALALSRPGTVIIGDNVVRGGAILEADPADARVQGVRQYLTQLGAASCLRSTALQTVGEKGWDGFSVSVVSGPVPSWHRAEEAAL
jgi:predicted O-methyltransferase YrrM